MATPNRAALLTKLHKVLKKHYKAVGEPVERTLLDHLLYACCLENSSQDSADEAFARLQQRFFDWNEVRVSTLAELAGAMTGLENPQRQAGNLKRVLQSVFETHYAFDLEPLRKQNLGKSEKQLEKYTGITPFVVAYGVQHGLGGHAIPVDRMTLNLALALEVVTPQEAEKGTIPGAERAIPKNKGHEFAELLHHLAVDATTSPNSAKVKATLNEMDSEARARLAKLNAPPPAPPAKAPEKNAPAKGAPAKGVASAPSAKSPPPAAPSKPAPTPVKGVPPAKPAPSAPAAKAPAGKTPADDPKKKPAPPKAPEAKPAPSKPAEPKRAEPHSTSRADLKRLAKKKPR